MKAGDGNRTHVACLEGRYSTIELHPRFLPPYSLSLPFQPRSNETWVEQDSNLRRHCHQIYSLAPLAAWVSTRNFCFRRTTRRSPEHAQKSPSGRAGGGTRTHNPRFTKPMLYRLSYASSLHREIVYYNLAPPHLASVFRPPPRIGSGDRKAHHQRGNSMQSIIPRATLSGQVGASNPTCSGRACTIRRRSFRKSIRGLDPPDR